MTNGRLVRILKPITLCAGAMAGLVLLVQSPLDAALGDRFGLFAAIGTGIVAYLGLAWFLMRDTLRTALGFFLRRAA